MTNQKKLFIALGVVIVLILSVFLFNKKVTTPDLTKETTTKETTAERVIPKNTVIYKDGFFTPANLSLKMGVTISFVNEGDDEMWVAANPHPAHTSLPSFDAKRGYKKGEVYKYIFTKKGSFGYHNHLNPMARGTLTVN